MKITKRKLKQLIKEEAQRMLSEDDIPYALELSREADPHLPEPEVQRQGVSLNQKKTEAQLTKILFKLDQLLKAEGLY